MTVVEGKFGIKATVLADSVAANGSLARMVTYELEYPRIILAELNTHRANPKNSHSSRAIPFRKMVEQLNGRPVRFGEANPGMQDKGEDHDGLVSDPFETCEDDGGRVAIPMWESDEAWEKAREFAAGWSKAFYEGGYHKQVYNRLTEPFQMMRTVFSGTEYGNFFWLRNNEAADPTLQELARVMYEARQLSTPQALQPGEWHVPYVRTFRNAPRGIPGEDTSMALQYSIALNGGDDYIECQLLTADEALKVSAARCAAVSFRNEDYGLEKCLEVHGRLVGDERKHASAFEHQCTPQKTTVAHWALHGGPVVNMPAYPSTWEDGISHMDREGNFWSGPLRGFVQYRKLIPGENHPNVD